MKIGEVQSVPSKKDDLFDQKTTGSISFQLKSSTATLFKRGVGGTKIGGHQAKRGVAKRESGRGGGAVKTVVMRNAARIFQKEKRKGRGGRN